MVATRVSTTNGIPQPTLATALPTSAMPSHAVRPMQARIPAHQAASPMCSNAPVRTVTPDAIVTHWSAEGNCGVIEGGQAHGPASKGGVGPTAFCSKAVGAVLIEGSEGSGIAVGDIGGDPQGS